MGVAGLGQYIKKHCPHVARQIGKNLDEFKGKRLAFDTSCMMYKYVATCNSVANNDHLKSFVNLWKGLIQNGIFSIFIFDGRQTFAKKEENEKRSKLKEKARQKLETDLLEIKEKIERSKEPVKTVAPVLTGSTISNVEGAAIEDVATTVGENVVAVVDNVDSAVTDNTHVDNAITDSTHVIDEYTKLLQETHLQEQLHYHQDKMTRVVKSVYYKQLQEIFDQQGIPYVVARYEAEQACSWLVKEGFAEMVIADDYDCLPCGAPHFLQHFNGKGDKARIVQLQPLLEHLKMTREQFVDFCILLGTDFGGHIHKVGPIKARDVIQKYKTIERFLASSEGKKFRSEEVFNYDVPRLMFLDESFPIEKISGEHENWSPFETLRVRYKEEEEKNPFPKERFHASLTRAELNEQAKRMRQEEEDDEESPSAADDGDVAVTQSCPPPSAVRKRGRIIRI